MGSWILLDFWLLVRIFLQETFFFKQTIDGDFCFSSAIDSFSYKLFFNSIDW